MKLVIGVAGPNGAGKDTFVEYFSETLHRLAGTKPASYGSGDIIMSCLRAQGIPETRPNAQKFVETETARLGKGFLSGIMRRELLGDRSRCVIFNGVRLPTDVEMLAGLDREGAASLLVFIDARAELRFERMKRRKMKIGESELAPEQFAEQESAMTESFMPLIKSSADYEIDNNGDEAALRKRVEEFCGGVAVPILRMPRIKARK